MVIVGLVLAAILPSALAVDRVYQFNVANGLVSPDGFSRQAVLVNGIYPGTTITANKGDRLILNVTNNLSDPTMRRSTTIVRIYLFVQLLYDIDHLPAALAWTRRLNRLVPSQLY